MSAAEQFGLLAKFSDPDALLAAARLAHAEGYRQMDAHTPFPVEGLHEALGCRKTRLPSLVFLGGLLGGTGGFLLQYHASVVDYPMNVGGRPLDSWPSFIVITFELAILCAALFAVLGMLVLNKLPMPYHPLFNAEGFALASRDCFFLSIESTDPLYDPDRTRKLLESSGALEVNDVAP